MCHGGFADVWKGRHQGRDVAAKVLRVYVNSFEKIRRVGYRCSQLVTRPNELTIPRIEILQGGCDMECPSSSERATTGRRDDDRDSIRDGVGVDGKGEHQRPRESGP